VNARLPFISVDLWYRRLPNNAAVLIVGTQNWHLATADILRLTTINRDRTRPNETIIYTIHALISKIRSKNFVKLNVIRGRFHQHFMSSLFEADAESAKRH